MNGKEKKRRKRKIDWEEQKQNDRKIETNRIRGGEKKGEKGERNYIIKSKKKTKIK